MGRRSRILPKFILSVVGILALAAVLAQQAPVVPAGEYDTYSFFQGSAATENITQGGDGAIYVKGMDDKVVWRVTSDGMVGSVDEVASIPGVVAVVGVTPNENRLVVTAFAKPIRMVPAGRGTRPINLSDVVSVIIA